MRLAPLDQLVGKTIIIFGLGVEGRSTFSFIRKYIPEAKILLADEKPLSGLSDFWQDALTQPQVEFFDPKQELALRDAETAVMFKTPGIPAHHPFVQSILRHDGELLSNTQLFFELVEAHNDQTAEPQLITVGVTGTKGKSTTTSMIHHVLTAAGHRSYLAGNIGIPALSAWEEWQAASEPTPTHFVIELSAHQLAELSLSPHIAVVQDISPEHLDYYEHFEAYKTAKSSIVRYQTTSDMVIFNGDSDTATEIAATSPGNKLQFSLKINRGAGIIAHNHLTVDDKPVLAINEVPLKGTHNLYNVFPALIIGNLLGISTEKMAEAVRSFQPLAHRIELVGEVNGVNYYDDSIATTPEAAVAALDAFPTKKIVLIAGGHDRNLDFKRFARVILDRNVTTLLLFPTTGAKIKKDIELEQEHIGDEGYQLETILEVNTMKEAVTLAAQHAEPGDIVLLSPAAASFGLFVDYQDRGDQFKAAVQALTDTPDFA